MSDSSHDRSPMLGGQRRPGSGDEPGLTGDHALLHALEMLNAPDEQTRQEAAFALAALGDERAVEHLVGIIRNGEQEDRLGSRAALALARFGRSAIPRFVTLAQDSDPEASELRMWGLIQTAVYHPELLRRVVRILVGILEHGDDQHRESTASLIKLMIHTIKPVSPPGLIPGLLRALDDDHEMVRIYALHALGYLRDNRAVPRLRALLQDPNTFMYQFAIEALEEIGTPEALRALKEQRQAHAPLQPPDADR